MSTTTTIKDWLSAIADKEIRENALAAMIPGCEVMPADSLSVAIRHGFEWEKTPHGYQFWAQVVHEADRSRIVLNTVACSNQLNHVRAFTIEHLHQAYAAGKTGLSFEEFANAHINVQPSV
jgi:hypothetical protein